MTYQNILNQWNTHAPTTLEKATRAKSYAVKSYDIDASTPTIDSATLYNKAIAITIRAILTNYGGGTVPKNVDEEHPNNRGGNTKMRELYYSAIAFARDFTDDGKGGADMVQDVACYLWQYNGKTLDDEVNDGQTDRDGNTITILRGAFRAVGKTIYAHAQREYKRIFIEDYESEHGQIAVPAGWDVEDAFTFARMVEVVKALELTDTQYQVLVMRFHGMSTYEIAEKRGVTQRAIAKTLKQVQARYTELYGVPENVQI